MKTDPESDKWERILENEGLGVIRSIFNTHTPYAGVVSINAEFDVTNVVMNTTDVESISTYWHDFSERVNAATDLTSLELDFLYRYCEHGNRSRAARELGITRGIAQCLVARFSKEN